MTNVANFRNAGLLAEQPEDGSIFLARHGETSNGHAGIVAHVSGQIPERMLATIEGNTMPGKEGDQRQGDGVFLRARNVYTNGELHTKGFITAASLLSLLS